MTKLVRFDEILQVRAELDQVQIERTGRDLVQAIDQVTQADPNWHEPLVPLRAYAMAGVEGRVTSPRIWRDEPLSYEFGEGAMPKPVLDAYAEFTFWTHGLTFDEPKVTRIDGLAYVEVED